MKNIDNAYLVLSVADIRAMLAAAELEQERRNDFNPYVSLVLQDILVYPEGPSQVPQIASWSVNAAVTRAARETQEELEVLRASRNASDMAQPVRDALGMNHSDSTT